MQEFYLGNESQYVTNFQQIGKGTYSVVYLGKLRDTGQEIAIKKFTADIPEQIFRREINNMCSSDHPNIVKIYDAFLQDQFPYIILQYCANGTLAEELEALGIIKEDQARVILKSVLEAVSYLHSNQIIHRDIKAENIYLDENNNVLLGDFGSSKFIANDTAQSFVGTMNYMSPEIIRSYATGTNYDRKVDIWSIGILTFHLLEHNFPFQVSYGVSSDMTDGSYIHEFCLPHSEEVLDFIDKCLQPEPEDRPDAAELLKHPFITGEKLNVE